MSPWHRSLLAIIGFSLTVKSPSALQLREPNDLMNQSQKDDSCKQLTHGQNVSQLLLYHLSKCGGTEILGLFDSRLLNDKFKTLWGGEAENDCLCTEKYNAHPRNKFVLATVRNPFSYYGSLFNMHVRHHDLSGYINSTWYSGCLEHQGDHFPYDEVIAEGAARNKSTFQHWLRFVLGDAGRTCIRNQFAAGLRISSRHDYMMLARQPDLGSQSEVVYDAIVKLEEFWPALEVALQKFECFHPGSVNWHFFFHAKSHGMHLNKNKALDRAPYHCLYDEETKDLVQMLDASVFERYGYNFEDFVHQSKQVASDCSGMRA